MTTVQNNDSLKNLVANLGTERDKASGTFYTAPCTNDDQLSNMYRSAWLPKKIVDIPALDACRKWRNWQAKSADITKIEAEEKRLGLKAKVLEAWTRGRLYGGAGLYIGTNDADPSKPLNPQTVKAGGVRYLTVLSRRVLNPKELETDPLSEFYNLPRAYDVSGSGGNQQIHPSRIVRSLTPNWLRASIMGGAIQCFTPASMPSRTPMPRAPTSPHWCLKRRLT